MAASVADRSSLFFLRVQRRCVLFPKLQGVVFLIDAFLRVHCVTSWGVDTAVRSNGSVVSACFASIATGCGGGILAALFLDATASDSWMDKVTRVIVAKKRWLYFLS